MTLTKRPCKEHFQSTEQDLFFFFVHATPTVFLTDFTPLKPYMMADSLKCTAKFIPEQNLHRFLPSELFKQASYHNFPYIGHTNK